MKNRIKIAIMFSATVMVCMTAFLTSCEEDTPGKYAITNGTPIIHFVKPANIADKDLVLTGAYMGETICIVGDNLTSVQELFFNDKKAILNINLITKNTLFVTIPRDVPENPTDKIYFINKDRVSTEYDFVVYMPAPIVSTIVCEHVPEGKDVVITGDYFFDDDPNTPVKVKVGVWDVPDNEVIDIQKTSIRFKAPPGDVTGRIQVITMYGTSAKSAQIFRDTRGMILDFESNYVGWWGGTVDVATNALYANDPEFAITGRYLIFDGEITDGNSGAWGQMDGSWNIYYSGHENGLPAGTNLFPSDPRTSIFRFEVNVVRPWSALGMLFFFGENGMGNGPLWNSSWPVGIWMPWSTTSGVIPYTSDGWITVSIPISEFNKDCQSGIQEIIPPAFGAFNLCIIRGGVQGVGCTPKILIDNIRVVPGN